MRDRRDNRDFSPKYRDRRRDHLDRHVDVPRHHKLAPPTRLVSLSPPPTKHRRSPHRRDLMQRQPDHHKPVHRDYPSLHHPRSHHSPRPRLRDYHHDVHVPSYMHPDYPTDLSHGIKHPPLGLDPQPLPNHKTVFMDGGLSRSYEATLKQDSFLGGMMTHGVHDSDLIHRHSHTRDLFMGNRNRERGRDREGDRDRERDRETGRGLYQREAPHPVTLNTTQLGPNDGGQSSYGRPIDGGQSSYGHGRLRHEHAIVAPEDISRVAVGRLPDDRRESRDRVSDHYNNIVHDDMYKKTPYTTLGCSRADGMSYTARSVREGGFYSDLPHHSTHKDVGPVYHGFEQGYEARPLHRREAPLTLEGRHEFHREVACVAEREISESPIFPDHAKGLHHADYSPSHNGYVDDLGYEPSHERLMARERQLHHVYDHDHDHDHDHDRDHVIYDDSIFDDNYDDVDNDDNDDGDGDGHVLNQRITVKDRLNLSSQQIADVDRPIVRRAVPSRKPVVMHGKHNLSQTMSVPATMRNNSVKKRLRLPLDPRSENFRTHKMQRRELEDKPNFRKVSYEYEKGSEEDAANRASPIIKDPPEGSEEFNKQVEKAFIKYTRIINVSSEEKKKFLQPGKGSLVCYVCGRSVFFSLH